MTVSAQSRNEVSESVVDELSVAFQRIPADLVRAVVREAERDLAGQVSSGSLGELLHRLAAYRLEQLVARS